jgi:thiol-disulfide isomerase/thioredoxin
MLAEARGHALLGNSEGAADSVRTAFEWGLVDFEQVIDDPVLCQTQKFETIRQLATVHRQQYCSRIRPSIRSAIAGFKPFNFNFSLAGRNSRRVSKTDLPSELLVVDLWATWCSPCRASIPHLNRLHTEYSSRGVKVLGIAFEQGSSANENQSHLDRFVKQNQVQYMCLLGDDTIQGQIPGKGGMPTLVFIDRQGRVRFCTSGFHDYSQISTIVEELLEEKSDEQE